MKRIIILAALVLLFVGNLKGQVIPEVLADLNEMEIPGWKVSQSFSPDLNGDSSPDAILVCEEIDQNQSSTPDQVIVIYLSRGSEGEMVKVLENREFLSHAKDSIDLYPDVSIEDDQLVVSFFHEPSMGSWNNTIAKYYFKYLMGAFHLTSYRLTELKRNTGEIEEYVIDFEKEEITEFHGSIEEEELTKGESQIIHVHALKSLGDITPPFRWSYMGYKI